MGIVTKLALERYTALWRETGQLKQVAKEEGVSELKVRKLLITAGVYGNAQGERIRKMLSHGMGAKEIVRVTRLGPKVVDSYIPYKDGSCWGLGKPGKLHELPIYSSSRNVDVQPWLARRCETLIQSFLSLDLLVDTCHATLVNELLPLASQYALALRSLATKVFGLEMEHAADLDYGNLTLVDVMVAYQMGRWLKTPWNGEGKSPSAIPFSTSLVREGVDIRLPMLHDVRALGTASHLLCHLLEGEMDEPMGTLLAMVQANLDALSFSLTASRTPRPLAS